MRRLLLGFITIMLSCSVGCSNAIQNYNSQETPAAPEQQVSSEDTGIRLKEVLVGNKPVVGLPYEQVIRYWGKPGEVKKLKVHFPAATEQYYIYLLRYDGVDIEMYPELEGVPLEKTSSFRFDITGSQYDFEGMKIGMDVGGDYEKYGKRQEYLLFSILEDKERKNVPAALGKVLTDLKEPGYYNSYDKAFYTGGALVDGNGTIQGAIGFAVLIKNDKIARIVYGLPTAG